MAENIHFEADNTVVAQNNDRNVNICVAISGMRLLCFALIEHLEQPYTFDALIGNRLPRDQFGPVRACRVICNTGRRKSLIPVGILREVFRSHAGVNSSARPEVTSYFVNALLTPISIGYDIWTVPENNQIELQNAEVSLDANMNFITLGGLDLNRLRFFSLPGNEGSPRRFGFEIEEFEEDEANAEEREDESETETVNSSDEDL